MRKCITLNNGHQDCILRSGGLANPGACDDSKTTSVSYDLTAYKNPLIVARARLSAQAIASDPARVRPITLDHRDHTYSMPPTIHETTNL